MIRSIRRSIAILIAFTLLLGLVHISPAAAASTVRDGTFNVSFRYVKDGESSTSAADSFMLKDTGMLIITNGKAVFEHQITKHNYATFEYFGARQPGAAKAVISTSSDVETVSGADGYTAAVARDAENADNVVIQLEIEDVYKSQDILMHINDKENIFGLPTSYNHWYNAQLELQLDGIDLSPIDDVDNGSGGNVDVTLDTFNARVAAGKEIYNNAVEGETDGLYPAGSRQELLSQITTAEAIVTGAPSNTILLQAAYTIVDQAIKKFEASRIVVNRTVLSNWIAAANAWLATNPVDTGVTETGAVATLTVGGAFSDGEYPTDFPDTQRDADGNLLGLTDKVKLNIAAAEQLLADPLATQSQVNTMYNNQLAPYNWDAIAAQQYQSSEVEIYVLDSMAQGTNVPSIYASEIADTAVFLKQAGTTRTVANITFLDNPDDEIEFTEKVIAQPSLSANTGLFGKSYSSSPAKLVTLSTNDIEKVYQTYIRAENATYPQTDMLWQGITKLKYPMTFENNTIKEIPGVTPREIFISFNASQHKALLALIDQAQQLHDDAVEGSADGQYATGSKEELQAAIDASTEQGGWMAAPRPQILAATTSLQAAVDQFNTQQTRNVSYSVAHTSDEAFSTLDSYFAKPAQVSYVDVNSFNVKLTINNSSSVSAFKIKTDSDYADVDVVSEDTTANTRVISFEVSDLAALLDAQLTIVNATTKAEETSSVRLNFNNVDNGALLTLIKEATTAHDSAVTGTAAGQYSEVAKTALQTAITAANKEAVRTPAAASDTTAAIQSLQRAFDTFKESYVSGGGTGSNSGTTTPSTGQTPQYPANGSYYMSFEILKNGTNESSIMNTYVYTTALVTVSGNTKTVSFTVKQSKEIVGLKLNGSSGTVTSADTASNTRVVTFKLSSLSSKLSGWVSVNWPAVNYVHSYDVQYLFDEDSASYAGDNPTVPGGDGNVGAPSGLDNPGSTTGGSSSVDDEGDEETAQENDNGSDSEGTTSTEPNNGSEETTNAVQFSDINNHWAKSSIETAVKLGIVNGFSDGSFRPNNIVTRGEFAAMISRALKLEDEGTNPAFQDSIPDWAKSPIARTVVAGLMQGFSDNTFRPSEQLSRAQLAVIIARAANLELSDSSTTSFSDWADVPAWAKKEVAAAADAGLILGKGNNFAPNDTATRAEALTLIIRLLEYLGTK
ncbi:heme-binding NEAT domain protein [Paenibacillus cellulosilyticus]|uniref:Heme-binding NEAT domain protein n=1 Tax=Paenibacillus cellulosilyticus TaxID=375489 RepID=A0A2V2YR05_9BACL|nr:NEAT domain-containing protein [Paenibacillus cellulosilyticus]PWV99486.1 heme-binding NEAT domain protein [Paenibacillus cellulosilyticus]QKS44740.1 NEAT domain-containing protein [Paenibacillus cellulosilyticus]